MTVRYTGRPRLVVTRDPVTGGELFSQRILETYRVTEVTPGGQMRLELDLEPTGPHSGLDVTLEVGAVRQRPEPDDFWPDPYSTPRRGSSWPRPTSWSEASFPPVAAVDDFPELVRMRNELGPPAITHNCRFCETEIRLVPSPSERWVDGAGRARCDARSAGENGGHLPHWCYCGELPPEPGHPVGTGRFCRA